MSVVGTIATDVRTDDAIVRLWKSAVKDDDQLLDEAIAKVYGDMISFDRGRAEVAMSLTIRRQRDAKDAFKSFLRDLRSRCKK